jgi:hypothetical protein
MKFRRKNIFSAKATTVKKGNSVTKMSPSRIATMMMMVAAIAQDHQAVATIPPSPPQSKPFLYITNCTDDAIGKWKWTATSSQLSFTPASYSVEDVAAVEGCASIVLPTRNGGMIILDDCDKATPWNLTSNYFAVRLFVVSGLGPALSCWSECLTDFPDPALSVAVAAVGW